MPFRECSLRSSKQNEGCAFLNSSSTHFPLSICSHSWAEFKIVLLRKPWRKLYHFMAKFQGIGFSFQSLNQNIKVMVLLQIFDFKNSKLWFFPSNFWIQFFKVQIFEILPQSDDFLEWIWVLLRNVITLKMKWE